MGFKTYTCPIAKACGGCEWLAVPYPIQLRRKQKEVEKLFSAAAERDHATIEPIRGMEDPRAFRNKAATPFAPGKGGRIRSGFFAAGSHRIVRCDSCLVEDPRARDILNDVARVAERLGIRAYQEDRGRGTLRHAIVRCGYATEDILLTLVTNGQWLPREREFVAELTQRHPEISSIAQNINQRRTNAMLGRECKTLFGSGIMHDKLLGCTFEISPTSFYQTNPRQTEVLYQLSIDACQQAAVSGEGNFNVLDAYCGTGTIGMCIAKQDESVHVTGVEQVHDAVDCAKRNARANSLDQRARFVAADATEYMNSIAESGKASFDVVVMDPPRAGSTPQFLDGVTHMGTKTVVYVSCNPKTQLRDIEHLQRRGYRLRTLTPVDMFPHTKHIETVALLTKRG